MRRAVDHRLRTGLITVLLAVLVVGLVVNDGPPFPLPWQTALTLKVSLASAQALEPNADVEVAGVEVGHVTAISSRNATALVTFVITDRTEESIRSSATVLLRPHGLFGPLYLDIEPGATGAVLSSEATIPIGHTVQPVSLADVLGALQAPERQNLATAIIALGEAAQGNGPDVHQLLVASDALTQTIQPAAAQLSADSSQINSVLHNADAFNADFEKAPLAALVANTNTTLQSLATNSAHLQDLLVQANSGLGQLNTDLQGETANLHQAVALLPTTLADLDTFNASLSLFARNLTGTDSSMPNDTNDVPGIVAAIDNPDSAFSSYDCTVSAATCPAQDRDYYLKVQVFNLAGTGGLSTQTLPVCQLPITSIAGSPRLDCTSTSSLPETAGGGRLLISLAAMLGT